MKDWKQVFEGKRITVMGLGLLGRGVGDARFLAEHGAELIVTDIKGDEELRASLEELKSFPNIEYRLGGHELADFQNRDFILKAAGVPFDSLYIEEAQKNHIPVKMSASWFLELSGIPSIGITGTRGKSTVTALMHDIMKAGNMEVLLGGNVRGVSTLALLSEVTQNSIALLELDSWQCHGFGEAKMSPNIAVFTTFMDDHLNYYHNDRSAYLDDKAQIFLHQKPEDTLVIGSGIAGLVKEKYAKKIHSHVVIADAKKFPKKWEINILGEHNKLNVVCAIEASRALGIVDEIIQNAVAGFKGMSGRLEFLRELNGVKIYNDNNSTTPDATIAALRALAGEKKTILIFGGADKMLDIVPLLNELPIFCKKVILLAGSGTENIQSLLPDVPVFDGLTYALQDALDEASEGDTILFSPAFASFGMFKNEYERGDQFVDLVKNL